ncbi:MAG: M28 family peptidase [Oligoflexales bacterium]
MKRLISILVLTGCGSVAPQRVQSSQSEFEASLANLEPKLQMFAGENESNRKEVAAYLLESDEYGEHLQKYLTYYRSIDRSFDIFEEDVNDEVIDKIEKSTAAEFFRLQNELFGPGISQPYNLLHAFLFPDSYFRPEVKEAFEIAPEYGIDALFEDLKAMLPPELPYNTRLEIVPGKAGGSYSWDEDKIVFGDYPPNISNVLGFIHEFGHSVFRMDSDNAEHPLYVHGFNEAYGEVWANNVFKYPFMNKLFKNPARRLDVEKYIQYRSLWGIRFHLVALQLERLVVKTQLTPQEYAAQNKILAEKYLGIKEAVPFLAMLPQVVLPGYLPSYLLINFVGKEYSVVVDEKDPVAGLLKISTELKGDLSEAHFQALLKRLIGQYFGVSEVFLETKLREFSAHERQSAAGRAAALDYLTNEYETMGFEVTRHNYEYEGFLGTNLVAERRGANPDLTLIVSAHYDSVGTSGADDNGSGVVSALAVARALKDSSLAYNLRIVSFDQEEKGLIGSKAYAKFLSETSEAKKIIGVINLDMTGYDGDGDGAYHAIDCNQGQSLKLSANLEAVVATRGLNLTRVPACSDKSDHAAFWPYGIPAIAVAQNLFGGDANPCVHLTCDTLEKVNFAFMGDLTEAVIGTVEQIVTL